jgi:hypothetical protein
MAVTKPKLTSAFGQPGRPADCNEIRRQLDGSGTRSLGGNRFTIGGLAANGACEFVGDDNAGELRFRIGAKQRGLRVLAKLMGNDMYTVQVYRVHRRTFEVVVLAERTNVHCEDMRGALDDLHGEVSR